MQATVYVKISGVYHQSKSPDKGIFRVWRAITRAVMEIGDDGNRYGTAGYERSAQRILQDSESATSVSDDTSFSGLDESFAPVFSL